MQHVRPTTGTLLREGGREKHCSQKHCHLGRLRSDDASGDRVGETVMVLGLDAVVSCHTHQEGAWAGYVTPRLRASANHFSFHFLSFC